MADPELTFNPVQTFRVNPDGTTNTPILPEPGAEEIAPQVVQPAKASFQFSPGVDTAINTASEKYGIDPNLLRTFARIESSGRPSAQTGSYKGLFQLSDGEFDRHGGGNIFDAGDNANAAALKLKAESADFERKYGRSPSPTDLYMVHQQGAAGYGAHADNPNGVAWQNIRQFYPSDAIAQKAIWGNIPTDQRAQFGNVNNVTSGQFVDMWGKKVNNFGGTPGQSLALNDGAAQPKTFNEALDDFDSHVKGIKGQYGNQTAMSSPASQPSASPVSDDIAFAPPMAAGSIDPRLAMLASLTQPRQQAAPVVPGGSQNSLLAQIASGGNQNNQTANYLRMMLAGRNQNNQLAALTALSNPPQAQG